MGIRKNGQFATAGDTFDVEALISEIEQSERAPRQPIRLAANDLDPSLRSFRFQPLRRAA